MMGRKWRAPAWINGVWANPVPVTMSSFFLPLSLMQQAMGKTRVAVPCVTEALNGRSPAGRKCLPLPEEEKNSGVACGWLPCLALRCISVAAGRQNDRERCQADQTN